MMMNQLTGFLVFLVFSLYLVGALKLIDEGD
jgi:hypothetical protein